MENVCIYLRKSRADEEMEKTLGHGETLSKHRKALLKIAKEKNLHIVEIKEEIVSGESLFFRPKMLELLKEVEDKKYNGVLVMDMQRLGRGDMKEQGIILETFKNAKTKIITPNKIYDLNNDFDEEYSEFEAFMSRKELKMITRRMQGGRVRSVEDGNYIASAPPYGYDIDYILKSRTLKINEHEAEGVKIIFDSYINGNGASAISEKLNNLGFKTKLGNNFSPSSVLTIIKNPVYIGKVTWKKKEIKKSKTLGKVKDTRTRDKSEWIIANGKHKPIISEEVWNNAQEVLKNKYHIPYQLTNAPINPLAGLLVCGVCGKAMVMRPSRGILRVMCVHKCGNKSVRFDYVEKAIIDSLEQYYSNKKLEVKKQKTIQNTSNEEKELILLENELSTLNKQRLSLFDFLERGIYTEDVFLERSKNIDSRINLVESEMKKVSEKIKFKKTKKDTKALLQTLNNAIENYKSSSDVMTKNSYLKSILNDITYIKTREQKRNSFSITLNPKLRF